MRNDNQQLKILTPNKTDFHFLEKYILPYEESSVQLSNYIKKKSDKIFILSYSNSVSDISNYMGILYLDSTVLHCIPCPSKFSFSDKIVILNYLKDLKISCINGKKEGTDFLVDILSAIKLPSQTNVYDLMILKTLPNPAPEPLCNSDTIIRCTKNNISDLFELQMKYLQQEVAPKGHEVSDLICKTSLKQILKEQLVLAIHTDDFNDIEFVSKANTNAIGLNWVQIGGVYTHPLFRKNYYAWHLISELCKRILLSNKKVSLFVREKNYPAISLYKKIGFIHSQKFTIVYY